MHAIRVYEYGDASKLVHEDVPIPEPKVGEVCVKVDAIGLNFAEINQRTGLYQTLTPFTPGGEVAGTVHAIGGGVSDFQIGERVATSNALGAYADYAIVSAAHLVPVPSGISSQTAAAVLSQGMTAHYLAGSTYPLKHGDTALIHAAAGGVGQLLVQIAKRRGAQVIATVSTDEKAQVAREAGADHVILYTQDDFQVETLRLTGGRGVDVVYDSVGKSTFLKSLDCLKPCGYMVLYGQASGRVDPIDPQILQQKGSLFLTRPSLYSYILTKEALLGRATDLFNWIASGELKVRLDRTFPLKDAGAAQRYMEERNTKGKVLLVP
jgi:NADPH2:quinone reductase